ncbi:MAG TPA: NapC/NirT family cytochrome c [Aggregatilineales bacterium]|nr:NapC/NirT family cytochrome c [Aggregatilineales bacterium]
MSEFPVEPPIQPVNSAAPASPMSSRRRRWPVVLAVGFIALIGFGGGGFLGASALEEHDTFCISCHTVPETTYYNHAYIALDNPSAQVPDLATQHYLLFHNKNENFACIDCHRGDSSLGQRVATLALGARDAGIYAVGREDPTTGKSNISEAWLPNSACISCHTDTLLTLKGLANHYHTHLPAAADVLAKGGKLVVPDELKDQRDALLKTGLRTSNTSLTCTSCHKPHETIQNAQANHFMSSAERNEACISCHKDTREGPQDAASLGG